VETVVGQHPVEHEARTGSLVTGSHRTFGRESAKEPSDLHEIPGKPHDLGLAGIVAENGGSDRILMNVETDPGRLGHGWIPPIES
jgi:hypothetical protein